MEGDWGISGVRKREPPGLSSAASYERGPDTGCVRGFSRGGWRASRQGEERGRGARPFLFFVLPFLFFSMQPRASAVGQVDRPKKLSAVTEIEVFHFETRRFCTNERGFIRSPFGTIRDGSDLSLDDQDRRKSTHAAKWTPAGYLRAICNSHSHRVATFLAGHPQGCWHCSPAALIYLMAAW